MWAKYKKKGLKRGKRTLPLSFSLNLEDMIIDTIIIFIEVSRENLHCENTWNLQIPISEKL